MTTYFEQHSFEYGLTAIVKSHDNIHLCKTHPYRLDFIDRDAEALIAHQFYTTLDKAIEQAKLFLQIKDDKPQCNPNQ